MALCDRKGTNFLDFESLTADRVGTPPQVSCPEECCNAFLSRGDKPDLQQNELDWGIAIFFVM
jgi:hypothetical protein